LLHCRLERLHHHRHHHHQMRLVHYQELRHYHPEIPALVLLLVNYRWLLHLWDHYRHHHHRYYQQ
jgi:membrane protein YdbS with pleckstrin-like domain